MQISAYLIREFLCAFKHNNLENLKLFSVSWHGYISNFHHYYYDFKIWFLFLFSFNLYWFNF